MNDWAKQLTLVAQVNDLNVDKLFKIVKLHLRGKAKEWFKKLNLASIIRHNYSIG
jgi:hypothetical protein